MTFLSNPVPFNITPHCEDISFIMVSSVSKFIPLIALSVCCFYIFIPLMALSVCSFYIPIYCDHFNFAMGSELTTHHAYLLLHRAFQSIPPTVIPDMVPAPPPGPGELDQHDYLRPTSSWSEPVPSMDEDEENDLFKAVTGHDLSHRMANAELPQPVRHLAAPDADDVPIPHSALSKSPLRASPKPAPTHRRRSTGSHLDKAAEARNISRSRSSSVRAIPRDWTPEDLAKLRELKKDTKARPNWNTVAGKLARSPDDCKKRWKKLKAEDAKK